MADNNDLRPDGNGPKPLAIKYKFRELKIHSSDEWMADGTKKYRQVYDRFETTYMRVEYSFFNKLFDEEEWEASITLKCFFVNGATRTELCNSPSKRKVLKDENVVYIRDSWGNAQPGAYWLKGNYVWEAYMDDFKVGEAKFYVEDLGTPTDGKNLFFDITSIKLFEGDAQASGTPQKKYLTTFGSKETRYVWGEFCFKSKTVKDYYAEVFFNFCDDAGQLKGRSVRLVYVAANSGEQIYTCYPSWGSEIPGTWKNDSYTMEVVFLDNLIATVPFSAADTFAEGAATVLTNAAEIAKVNAGQPVATSNTAKPLDDILFESMAELNALTGLDSIKKEVNEMVKLVRFYQESGKDILNKFSLHTVFTGNPGTGKTTVARIMSKIYKGLGILEKGHLVEVDRQGLVAGYVGQTAMKTGDKVTEAMGGILFIDEAYSLANEAGQQNDFGGEAIQVILKRMEDFRGKFGVIVAGYTDNMEDFVSSNPGLRSRFDKFFLFEDYSPEEMYTIAMALFAKEDAKPDDAAAAHLKEYFAFLHKGRNKNFGNARSVRQVVGESIRNQNLRLASMKKEDRTKELMEVIILEDVTEFEIKESNLANHHRLGFAIGGNK